MANSVPGWPALWVAKERPRMETERIGVRVIEGDKALTR
jgi:hypothetical protein